jgi:hypothetical protein
MTKHKGHHFQPGQKPWNTGTGGCKRGHDPSFWVTSPGGIPLCLMCKRENGMKWRVANRDQIRQRSRIGRYGMSQDEFEMMWMKHIGACAICGASFGNQPYRIDHCHKTGRVRGLLCVSCNTGIGLFKDNPGLLLNAMRYLSENRK